LGRRTAREELAGASALLEEVGDALGRDGAACKGMCDGSVERGRANGIEQACELLRDGREWVAALCELRAEGVGVWATVA
jgi:hypothetical protein